MVCYKCSGVTAVLNSRLQKRTNSVWRRRGCELCDAVFTTIEAIDFTKSFVVRSRKTKRLTPFVRDRLLLSLYKSLGHRTDGLTDASGLCATILAKLGPSSENGELSDRRIIEVTLVALNRFDTLAAQHYQAFHKL